MKGLEMEPLTIQELVSYIESRRKMNALRFEWGVYSRLQNPAKQLTPAQSEIMARIRKVNGCSVDTARMIYSTSWGQFQVMGFNLYADPAFATPIAEFLSSTTLQEGTFLTFLKRNGLQDFTPTNLAKDQSRRLKFSMTYNGSIAYEKAMIAALEHFGISVQ